MVNNDILGVRAASKNMLTNFTFRLVADDSIFVLSDIILVIFESKLKIFTLSYVVIILSNINKTHKN